jgi:hypothetical protein
MNTILVNGRLENQPRKFRQMFFDASYIDRPVPCSVEIYGRIDLSMDVHTRFGSFEKFDVLVWFIYWWKNMKKMARTTVHCVCVAVCCSLSFRLF